jgi:hypothetical protein
MMKSQAISKGILLTGNETIDLLQALDTAIGIFIFSERLINA